MWDIFISHASEDKSFVRQLADTLAEHGLGVWYDEYSLTVGDSLRRSIDQGIVNSRFGIVVLSPSFFAKEWPQRELDALTSMEITRGKTILPVWHGVGFEDVRQFSPTLADKLAVTTDKGIDEVVREVVRATRIIPDGEGGFDKIATDPRRWDRPKHELLRYVHFRILIPRRTHNPIWVNLSGCIARLASLFEDGEPNVNTRALDSRAHRYMSDALSTVADLQSLSEAVSQICSFSPGSTTVLRRYIAGYTEPGFRKDVSQLAATIQRVLRRQAVTISDLQQLSLVWQTLASDFFDEASQLRRALLGHVANIVLLLRDAAEYADEQIQIRGVRPVWQTAIERLNSRLEPHETDSWTVLGDRLVIRSLLRDALIAMVDSSTTMSDEGVETAQDATLSLQLITSSKPDGDLVRLEATKRLGRSLEQPRLELGTTFQDQRRTLQDYGGDVELTIEPSPHQLKLNLTLISWNVFRGGVPLHEVEWFQG